MTNLPMAEAYADSPGRRAIQEARLESTRSSFGDLHTYTLSTKSNFSFTLLLLGGRVTARKPIRTSIWQCNRPFRGELACSSRGDFAAYQSRHFGPVHQLTRISTSKSGVLCGQTRFGGVSSGRQSSKRFASVVQWCVVLGLGQLKCRP
jgi:hypothetical protein